MKNRDDIRLKFIKSKYGLTIEDYNLLLSDQKGKCYICGNEETSYDAKTKKVKSLSIDHNHKTGKVRGLLCSRCNALIGYAKEDIKILESAIKYINKYEKE